MTTHAARSMTTEEQMQKITRRQLRRRLTDITALIDYDIIQALEFAADLLEDVNAHAEARAVRQMIPEAQA